VSALLSLNARRREDAPDSGDVEIVLIKITHPDLAQPVRLSSDNLHLIDPGPPAPVRGVRSSWLTADGSPFLHVGMDALAPGDDGDAPSAMRFAVSNVTSDIGRALEAVTGRAQADVGYFLSADPDSPQMELLGMFMTGFEDDPATVIIDLSYDFLGSEPHPCDRMTKDRFPGLFK
jgi:hypothetical protein